MPRANAQPVRLSSDLLEKARQASEQSGRSLPMEIEYRLRASLGRGAWAELEFQLAGDARALGRLVAMLANDKETFGTLSNDTKPLKAAVGRLIDHMYGVVKVPDPNDHAELAAEYWWLRVFNARERDYERGTPMPMTVEQRALAEIRSDIPPKALSDPKAASRKERKL